MLIAVFAIALIVRSYMLLAAVVPSRVLLRDALDIVIHLLCLGLALLAVPVLHIEIRTALAAAFLADFVVHLREFLDILADLCKTLVLSRQRRR